MCHLCLLIVCQLNILFKNEREKDIAGNLAVSDKLTFSIILANLSREASP